MPMWGSQVTESSFAHSLSKFNANIQVVPFHLHLFLTPLCTVKLLQEYTGFREPNYQSTVHDIKLMPLKFAEEKSLSEDCGGGARHSNAKLIPSMFTIALYVMNSTRSSTREEVLIKQFIQGELFVKFFSLSNV